MIYRKATFNDVEEIYNLVNLYAQEGVMLARSRNTLYETSGFIPEVDVITQKKSSLPWNTINPPAAQASIAITRPIGELNPNTSIKGTSIEAAVIIPTVPEPIAVLNIAPII